MKNVRVARRYAAALMTVAEENRSVDAVAADLEKVEKLLNESRDLALFLASPVIPARKKMTVLREIFTDRVGKEVLTFFLLLTRKGREDFIPEVVRQFGILLDQRRGVVDVAVTTAMSVDKEQERTLQKRLEAYTSRTVRMNLHVDPSLQGGVVVQIGDTVLDGSVRHQLNVLKNRFIAGGTLS